MGELMATGPDNLLPAADARGKALVDNKKTSKQGIPGPVGKRYGMNWTEMLAKKGLETPGYKETVDQMRKDGRIKGY
jgi:hypothetical protein